MSRFEDQQEMMREMLAEINQSGVFTVRPRTDGQQGAIIELNAKGSVAITAVLTAANNELNMRRSASFSEEEIISRTVYFWEKTFELLPPWEQEALGSADNARAMFSIVGSALAVEIAMAMVASEVSRDELLADLGEGWRDDVEDDRL